MAATLTTEEAALLLSLLSCDIECRWEMSRGPSMFTCLCCPATVTADVEPEMEIEL
jgi:hypothetical protein